MRSWRAGFGFDPRASAVAPAVAVVLIAVAVATNASGDIREGAFPWLVAAAALAMVTCCLGILNRHGPAPRRPVLLGGWWTAAAFAGVAAFFVAIGIGDLLGIDEEDAGPLALLPVLAMAFGLLSMTPALGILAYGLGRAGVVPWWGTAAAVAAAPVLPAIMIFGGLVEGTAESVGTNLLLLVFGVALVMLGASLWRGRTSSVGIGS